MASIGKLTKPSKHQGHYCTETHGVVVMWIIRLMSSFENLSSAGTPHGLIDVMTTDHTGEDENSIATRNNACAHHFHAQEVGGFFPQ